MTTLQEKLKALAQADAAKLKECVTLRIFPTFFGDLS